MFGDIPETFNYSFDYFKSFVGYKIYDLARIVEVDINEVIT